jgi:hypothetical protein
VEKTSVFATRSPNSGIFGWLHYLSVRIILETFLFYCELITRSFVFCRLWSEGWFVREILYQRIDQIFGCWFWSNDQVKNGHSLQNDILGYYLSDDVELFELIEILECV